MREKERSGARKVHREKDAVLLLNRGKTGLLRLAFSRTGVVLGLLAIQFLLLFAAFVRLGEYYYGSAATASLIVSLVVVKRPGDPNVKITWIMLIFLLPVLGIPLYFYVNADLGYRLVHFRLKTIRRETAHLGRCEPELKERLRETEPNFARLTDYVEERGGHAVYDGSDAVYLPTGEETFAEMLRQLEQAKDFIFLEYFIIAEGYMWGRILNILERKAGEGVEVRVLYDGTCVMGTLPYQYPGEMKKLGIQCRMFAPLRPVVSTHYNNRDHRKIMIVDGRVAFTGGINLADEYINRRQPYGHWKDTAVMVSGRAVRGFTLMFLQMWNVESAAGEDYGRYLDASSAVQGKGCILPYGAQPIGSERVGEMVYIDILNRAVDYVHIMTPYLVPSSQMVMALTYAARRGVEVKLIMPGIPDKKSVFALGRSYYKELMESGVQVYEYTPGFVHGKMFVSDDKTAVVGSINLDYRSLHHHFECAALLHGCDAVLDVERDMQDTLAKCRAITAEDCRREKLWRRIIAWVGRPLAPLI